MKLRISFIFYVDQYFTRSMYAQQKGNASYYAHRCKQKTSAESLVERRLTCAIGRSLSELYY
jgi:CTP:phosphocholine cytidylyltransferase-like protein